MRIIAGIENEGDVRMLAGLLQGLGPAAEVHLVAVAPSLRQLPTLVRLPGRGWRRRLRELRELAEAHATARLTSLADALRQGNTNAKTTVLVGDPASKLISAARKEHADLIVLSKGEVAGHLGHVASRVARYAPCSVLLLNPDRPMPQVILLASDGSSYAQRAGERLRQLPLPGRPRVLVCAVASGFDPSFLRTGSAAYQDYERFLTEVRSYERDAAQETLDKTAALFAGTRFRVETRAYVGDTVEVLLRVVQESGVDLLALGAKGVSARARFLLGSVTLRLLNRAPCSILVAR